MPTPLSGWKYSTSSVIYNNSGGSLAGRWTTAQNNWSNATNFKFTSGSSTTFVTDSVNDSTVSWDGLTNTTWTTSTGIVTQSLCHLNTYYTSQSRYTQDIINGIATHEFGHAIGLAHSTSAASVMYPSTFDTEGNLARSNTPGADDITAINGIYAATTAASSSAASEESSDIQYVTVHPSWAYHYKDHTDLYQHADLVVEGIVSDEHGPIKLGPHPFHHYTTSSVSVEDVLQGDNSLKGHSIVVRQLGGEINGCCVNSDVSTPLKEGVRVILFLKQAGGIFYPINENAGIYLGYGKGKQFLNLMTARTSSRNELWMSL